MVAPAVASPPAVSAAAAAAQRAEIMLCHGAKMDEAGQIHVDDLGGFRYFLANHVYILDPPPGGGIIRWQPWDYLIEMAKDLVRERKLVVLKARQLGLSWLVAAYVVWLTTFRTGAKALLLSQGENEATELRKKCWVIWSHLPPWLRATASKDNDSTLEFDGNDSGIKALPSTENAGSGYTGSVVVSDEHSKHPHAADNYAAVEPTINAGGQFIAMSTASYLAPGTFFANLFNAARAGTNGFAWRFLGCMLRPGRDQAWYERTREVYSADPLTRLTFRQEYPRTIEEAFIIVAGVPVFDPDGLQRLTDGARPPIREEKYPLGYLRVWQEPVVGRTYVAGGDVSYGLGAADKAVCQVLDWQTGNHVAALWGAFPPEELVDRSVKLCQTYNNAFVGIEENGIGEFAIRRLGDSKYQNVYYRDWEEARKAGKRPEKLGWHTSKVNRPMIIGQLGEGIKAGTLNTWDADTIREFCTFVHLKGKQQAAPGMHDDRVLGMAIAQEMRQLSFVASRATSGGKQGRSYAGIGRSM